MVLINPRPNPYVGPRPFEIGETMHGRDREIRDLLNNFIAERIILFYSPSGAGKTSLLSAGLIPQLRANGFNVLPIIRISLESNQAAVSTPANESEELGSTVLKTPTLNRYIHSTLLSLEEGRAENEQVPIDELARMTLSDYLALRSTVIQEGDAGGEKIPTVLIFDQFEEILTLDPTDKESKIEFFAQLGAALRDRDRWALFAMREDYIAGLDPYLRPIPTRLSNRYRLDLLGVRAARQAIQLPAKLVQVEFTEDAAQKLVDDLRRVQVQQADGSVEEQLGQYIEPVQLQVVCYRLWQNLTEDTVRIEEPDLACVGDVNLSLAEYFSERVQAIAQSTGVRERLIRDWFQNKLITEQGIRGQVLRGKDESDGLDNRAIFTLVDAYLVRAEKRRGVTWFELVHDRLILPVRGNNEAWYAANLNLLQRQAALWVREGQPDHLLLRDELFDEAEAWAAVNQQDLTENDTEFLKACRLIRQRELEAREREAQTIKLQEQARLAKRLRSLLAVAVVAAIFAVVFAYFALQQRVKAEDNAGRANAASTQAVAQQVTAEFNADAANAASTEAVAQQAIAEYNAEIANAASTQAVAQQVIAEYNAELARENAEEAQKQAGLASSRQLAAQSAGYFDTKSRLASLLAIEAFNATDTWEARNMLLLPLQRVTSQEVYPYPNQIPSQPKDLQSVAISPDGQHLAFGSADGRVTYWDYSNSIEEWSRQEHNDNRVVTMDFNPDGKFLATGAAGRILLWDMEAFDSPPVVVDERLFPVYSLAFDPDRNHLAAAYGKRLVVYDASTFEALNETSDYSSDLVGVAWSPDGTRVAAIAKDGKLVVWRPETTNFEKVLPAHTKPGLSISWSVENLLATGAQDGNIIFWDTSNWRPIGQPLQTHKFGWVQSLSFSSDGRYLASGSDDKTVRIWDTLSNKSLGNPLVDHEDFVVSVDFSPKRGQFLLASAGLDNHIYLNEISPLQSLGQEVGRVDGKVIGISVVSDTELKTASLRNGQLTISEGPVSEQKPIQQHLAGSGPIAISPDFSIFATGQKDGTIQVSRADNGSQVKTLQGSTGQLTSLVFSHSGDRLATAYCGKPFPDEAGKPACEYSEIFIWDIASGEKTQSILLDSPGFQQSIAMQTTGPLLAVGSDEGYIGVFDTQKNQGYGMPGQLAGGVTSLAFSGDERVLASGGGDKSLQLWDISALQSIGRSMYGASDVLTSLSYDPGTGNLFAGASSGVLQNWLAAPQEWILLNCKLAGSNLSYNEWNQFFPGQPYQETCPGL